MTNLLFAGNEGVFDGILTCLLSIFRTTARTDPFRIFVFTMDATHLKEDYRPLSARHAAFLNRVAKSYGAENEVKVIDVTQLYGEEFSGCPNEGAYCSPYTLLRLLADLVPEVAATDKLLYLDADLLFHRDISLLYDQDVSDYEYAAARDQYGKYLVGPNYINAGVLLFNMPLDLRTGIFEAARGWLRRKELPFADQSALLRSTTKKKMLPQRFNEQRRLTKRTVIRHFAKRLFWFPYPHRENIKQWHVERVRKVFRYHEFDDLYEEYFRLKAQFESESEEPAPQEKDPIKTEQEPLTHD